MTSTKPVLVLVHGAWHSASCWNLLTPHLHSAGYTTDAVSLPSASSTNIQPDATADATAIASTITSYADAGRDVVLVMHSYGGVPGSSAVQGLTKADRHAQGKPGGVTHLIYVASFAIDEGVSLVESIGGGQPGWQPPDWWYIREDKKSTLPGEPIDRFYNDVTDRATLDRLVENLLPHALGAFYSKNQYAAYVDVPSTYVLCEKDHAVPLEGQKAMVEMANQQTKERGGEGGFVRTVSLDSSHSPMISMPERVAEEVRRSLEG